MFDKLYYENEERFKEINNNYFKSFVTYFVNKYGITNFIEDDPSDYINIFTDLKKYIYMYLPELVEPFYKELKKTGFNMVYNLFDDMYELGVTTNKKLQSKTVYHTKLSPHISDISYDGKIKIESIYGDVSFYSLKDYFSSRSSFNLKKIIRNNDLSGDCHGVSLSILDLLEDANLVTMLIPYYFEGTIYHSIVKTEDGLFIDAASYIVYDEKALNLLNGRVISNTPKSEIENTLEEAISYSQDPFIQEKYNDTLVLALYNQSRSIK